MPIRKTLLITLCFTLLSKVCFADITPSDVYRAAGKLNLETLALANHMGIDPNVCVGFTVENAKPREVYFQALRLLGKTESLYFEVTGSDSTQSTAPITSNIQPSDVLNVLKQAQSLVINMLQHLNIENPVSTSTAEAQETKTPSDVYARLLLINATLSELLEKKVTPSDTYETTTLSIYYAGEIINQLEGAKHPAIKEASVINKTSGDVYKQQLEILQLLKLIGNKTKTPMLSLKKSTCTAKITSQTTNKLAYIILSELAFLAKQKNISVNQVRSFYPGKKYPSDVYKRNLLLMSQLNIINDYAEKHPEWSNHDE